MGRRSVEQGQAAEARARRYLETQGLTFRTANYRTRRGEIDLIMTHDSTTVFVEVRRRRSARFGEAAGSVDYHKQRRLTAAAADYLQKERPRGPCRFDVVCIEGPGETLRWIPNAFDAAE